MMETKYCIICGRTAKCWFGKVYSTKTKVKKRIDKWGTKEKHTHIDAGFCDMHKNYNIDTIKKTIKLNPHIDFDCQFAKEHGGTECFGTYDGEIQKSIISIDTFGERIMMQRICGNFNKKHFSAYYIVNCKNNLKKRFLNDDNLWAYADPQKNKKFVKTHKLNDLDEKIILYEKKRRIEEKQKKEIMRQGNRKRRALMKNIIENFTINEWIAKRNTTNGICPICRNFVGVDNLTLDHTFPISKAESGRIYTINDVQPICKSCNSSKNDRLIDNTSSKDNTIYCVH